MKRIHQVHPDIAGHRSHLLSGKSDQVLKGTSIAIIGINDYIGNIADFPAAIVGYEKSDFTLVLTHCPEHRDIIAKQNTTVPIDLVLSGHTHGGQVAFWGFAPVRPVGSGRYTAGFYKESEPHLYVSKGVGTSIMPIRFGARAEIALFHVKA